MSSNVSSFFDRYAHDFNAIYGNSNGPMDAVVNRLFRRSMALRYQKTLELVRADIAQGLKLNVRGTPTFFMNGIQLPNLRGEFFEAAVEWELRRTASQ